MTTCSHPSLGRVWSRESGSGDSDEGSRFEESGWRLQLNWLCRPGDAYPPCCRPRPNLERGASTWLGAVIRRCGHPQAERAGELRRPLQVELVQLGHGVARLVERRTDSSGASPCSAKCRVPPGLSTRRSSRRAAPASGIVHNVIVDRAVSKVSSVYGRAWPSSPERWTDTRLAATRSAASCQGRSDGSTAVTRLTVAGRRRGCGQTQSRSRSRCPPGRRTPDAAAAQPVGFRRALASPAAGSARRTTPITPPRCSTMRIPLRAPAGRGAGPSRLRRDPMR